MLIFSVRNIFKFFFFLTPILSFFILMGFLIISLALPQKRVQLVSYSERRQSRGPGEKVDLNRGKKFLLPGPIIINFNLLKSKYWLKFHIYFSFQDLSWELICKLNDLKIHVLLTARKLFNLAVIQRELRADIL